MYLMLLLLRLMKAQIMTPDHMREDAGFHIMLEVATLC